MPYGKLQKYMRYCTSCGKEVSSEKKFCEYCGTSVGQPAAGPAAPVAPEAPVFAAAVPAKPSGGPQRTKIIAGIIGVLVIAAGIWFVGLPLISGPKGAGTDLPQSTVLPGPSLTRLPATISQNATPPPVSSPATTAPPAVPTPPVQEYKNVDLVLALNTQPAYGFTMDYPAEWTYKREHTRYSNAGYNFSSPDNRSYVYVGIANGAGAGAYFYPLHGNTDNPLDKTSWEYNVIKGMTVSPYCHDGGGGPTDCPSSLPASVYNHFRVISNETVILSGNVMARKIVFAPDRKDPNLNWWNTVYLMHVGPMQGYNFTVPDHFEVAKKVSGTVWDYGMGGLAYSIEIVTPTKKDSESPVYDHMIQSFAVTGI
jgi:hypothetical protein